MRMKRKPSMADADYAIAERLILDDYNRFLTALPRLGEDAFEPKLFALRHTSARTALAHLEQLKRSVLGESVDDTAAAAIAGQLDAARAAMASLAAEEAEAGTDDADGHG